MSQDMSRRESIGIIGGLIISATGADARTFREYFSGDVGDAVETPNEGLESIPFPLLSCNIDGDTLYRVVEAEYADPLPDVTSHENNSLTDMSEFLRTYNHKLQQYYGTLGTEIACDNITGQFVSLAHECGINVDFVTGHIKGQGVNNNAHAYGVSRINGKEYRFDYSANQFTQKDVGLVVTPRIENLIDGRLYRDEGIADMHDPWNLKKEGPKQVYRL